MRLGEEQKATFAARGVIRLGGLVPAETIAPARELAYQALESEGFCRDGEWIADEATEPAAATRALRKLRQAAKPSPAFKDLVTPALLEAVGQLVGGQPVKAATERAQILFTAPGATSWTVPHKIWHLDVPRLGEIGLPGVQMFAFLNAVAPGAGGTLVLAGSHRLLNDQGRIKSKDVKARLKQEPYVRELLKPSGDRQHFVDAPGRVGDVEVQVVELHGEPGDVYLTDLRLLHTLAPNASRIPRLMVTQRFFLRSVIRALTAAEGEDARRPG